jgi:PAS domain S-box-containing protein
VVLLLLSVLFVTRQWAGGLVVEMVRQPFGWAGVWSRSIWTDLYDVYHVAATGIGLYLILRFGATTDSPTLRRQSFVFVTTGASSLLIGFVLNRLLPRLGSYGLPQLASLAGLIWGSGLVWAITRYNMLAITPATAAENIIATMTDLLLLVDAQGNIVSVNSSALDALGYSRADLVGHPIDRLLADSAGTGVWQEILSSKDRTRQWSLSLVRRMGERLPVLLSASRLKQETGDLAGIALVAKDITDRVRAEDAERERRVLAEVSRDTVAALSGTLDSREVMQRILVSVG